MTRRSDPREPWVSVDDVAAHLSVAKDTVCRWIESKGPLAHRLGRLWEFRLSDVDSWVRARADRESGPESSSAPRAT